MNVLGIVCKVVLPNLTIPKNYDTITGMIDEGIKSAAAVIRKLREDKGLSQVQLARMAEMTPAQLCKLV